MVGSLKLTTELSRHTIAAESYKYDSNKWEAQSSGDLQNYSRPSFLPRVASVPNIRILFMGNGQTIISFTVFFSLLSVLTIFYLS